MATFIPAEGQNIAKDDKAKFLWDIGGSYIACYDV